MENLNLIDQIYELEASCAAIVAEAKERALGMEVFARQEAEKALATAASEIYEAKKTSAAERNKRTAEMLNADHAELQAEADASLKEARAHKALAVAALVERTLG